VGLLLTVTTSVIMTRCWNLVQKFGRAMKSNFVKVFLSARASINISGLRRTPLHDLAGEFTADDFRDGAIQLLQDAGVGHGDP